MVKGTKKCVVDEQIRYYDFRDCLFMNEKI